MTTINDFQLLDWLLSQSGNVAPSAEDEYFDQVDDQPDPILMPVTTRVKRTTFHHYRHHTVITTESLITNRRQDVVVHIYHTKENQ